MQLMYQDLIPTPSDNLSLPDVILDSFISLIDNNYAPKYFNTVHEMIIRGSYYGKSYATIAKENGYDCGYIKTTGYQLWNLLSKHFGVEVRKKNIALVIRRHSLKMQQENQQNILNLENSFFQKELSSEVAPDIDANSEIRIENIYIAGSSIRVRDIVICHKQKRMSPDAIASQHPAINLSDVYAALAYYHRNLENS